MQWLLVFLLTISCAFSLPLINSINKPKVVLQNVEFQITIDLQWLSFTGNDTSTFYSIQDRGKGLVTEDYLEVIDDKGALLEDTSISGLKIRGYGEHTLDLCLSTGPNMTSTCYSFTVYVIPGVLSILPPIVTILAAIISQQVLIALPCGTFIACFFLNRYNPLTAFLRLVDTYIGTAMADPSHSSIILFILLIGAMIGVISKSGGALAFARRVIAFCHDRYKLQLIAYLAGWVIFFDDYSNALIIGSALHPIMKRMQVSPEKFAFIVDCTSAPVASIAPLSSWIGYELSLIDDGLKSINMNNKDPYLVFIQTIPYRFYPLLMLIFLFMIIVLKKDFGPMLRAERRVMLPHLALERSSEDANSYRALDVANREEEKIITEMSRSKLGRSDFVEEDDELIRSTSVLNTLFAPVPYKPLRMINAILPILTTLILTFLGVVLTGYYDLGDDPPTLPNLFAHGNSFSALNWGCFVGNIVILIMVVAQGILDLPTAIKTWVEGVKTLVEPVLTLIFAWSIGSAITDLQAGEYLTSSLQDLDVRGLPSVIFIIAAITSFCTGTSWGTMAITFPLAIPLANRLSEGDEYHIIVTISSILAGSIFGDHCSPLSDTTILSCAATHCPLTAHVRTQLPYALVVAVPSILLGDLAVGYKIYPPWVCYIISIIFLFIFIYFVGRTIEDTRMDCSICLKRCCLIMFGQRHKLNQKNKLGTLDEDDRSNHGHPTHMNNNGEEIRNPIAPLRLDYRSTFGTMTLKQDLLPPETESQSEEVVIVRRG